MKLVKNIGTPGRLLRLIIAIFLLLYALWAKSWIAFGLSIFTFYESAASWCLFYQLFGKTSCKMKKK